VLSGLFVFFGVSAHADVAPQGLSDALTSGKPYAALRYRFEQVDEEPFTSKARASILRLRFGYETAAWRGARALLEVDHLAAIGPETFDSTRNGRATRPIIADPPATDLNVAALRWQWGEADWLVGRQRLILDNQRFIGNVGWRQNEQTYDAITWRTKWLPRTALLLGYLDNVNRVFGPDRGAPVADWRMRGWIAHGSVDAGSFGTLTPFVHLMDIRNAPALSHRNVGVSWQGSAAAGAVTGSWLVSWAAQQEYGKNSTNYSARYWHLEVGGARGPAAVRVGREILGGDAAQPERRFQTPLATLHAFQGWADKFLVTPAQGIEDDYASIGLKWRGLDVQLVWHDFEAEAVDREYGSEWDLSLAWRPRPKTELLLKAARYTSDGFATDTTKLWLQVSAEFK
jgi:hypothetical protein